MYEEKQNVKRNTLEGEVWELGYILERSDRDRKGGGLACYVRNDLSYNVRDTLSDKIENIFVDIIHPKINPILVVVVYRPPDKSDFP